MLDAQECPAADVAVVAAVVHLVRSLTVGPLAHRDLAADPDTEALAMLLDEAILGGEEALVKDPTVLAALRLPSDPISLAALWRRMLEADPPEDMDGDVVRALETMVEHGPLGRRMMVAAGPEPTRPELRALGMRLCDCLTENVPFSVER